MVPPDWPEQPMTQRGGMQNMPRQGFAAFTPA
jgi:hypothetical protein